MPVEHETPPRDTEPSPIRIIADALQRASHIHTLCPPDEVRPNPNERLPPALASEGDLEITDRPEDVIVESLRITDRPLSIGSLISDRPRQISVDVLQDESPGPDFSAAEEGGRVTPAHASRSPVSVTPNPKAQQAKASEISTAPVYQPVDLSEYKPLPKYSSSFLRPGSKFVGTQQSDRQQYNVQVEIKYVDMAESFLCGYLCIDGLTADHPTLTTYFEGEIIGSKYTFQTKEPSWGSNEKVDMQHWNRFPAWKPLSREARRPNFNYKDYAEREHLFMRWKEYFLVPDHTVTSISGASFEGFYYICFNQITGNISGIYFHAKSEKFQQLELKHVWDGGCMASIDFC